MLPADACSLPAWLFPPKTRSKRPLGGKWGRGPAESPAGPPQAGEQRSGFQTQHSPRPGRGSVHVPPCGDKTLRALNKSGARLPTSFQVRPGMCPGWTRALVCFPLSAPFALCPHKLCPRGIRKATGNGPITLSRWQPRRSKSRRRSFLWGRHREREKQGGCQLATSPRYPGTSELKSRGELYTLQPTCPGNPLWRNPPLSLTSRELQCRSAVPDVLTC